MTRDIPGIVYMRRGECVFSRHGRAFVVRKEKP